MNGSTFGRVKHWMENSWTYPASFDEDIYQAGLQFTARQWLRRIDDETTAVFCVTLPAAMGVVRAAYELDISIGDELSVCTVDCEGIGKFLTPPIASFERPDPEKYMNTLCRLVRGRGEERRLARALSVGAQASWRSLMADPSDHGTSTRVGVSTGLTMRPAVVSLFD